MAYRKVEEEIKSLKQVNDTVEGLYLSTETEKGKRKNSSIHTIKTLEGNIVRFWGSAVIDRHMKVLTPGQQFKIVMTGEGTTKDQQKVKLFDFYINE